MIDFRVLEQFGTSNDQLRVFFTSWDRRTRDGKAHGEKHEKFRNLLKSRIQEGVDYALRHVHHYTVADLAWDGPPILPSTVPLMLYAQKKIGLENCASQLQNLNCADQFISTQTSVVKGESKTVKNLNVAKLVDTPIQVVRSYVSRRVYAQSNWYNTQHPFLPFESRFKSSIGRVRAALMSEYAQVMSDGFGYPHLQTQWTRDMLMYARAFVFPECAWETEKQTVVKTGATATEDLVDGKVVKHWPVETRITREGVPFRNIHPSRSFYDTAYPPSSLNTDTGCKWVGYYDVRRMGSVIDDPGFFNRDRVKYSSTMRSFVSRFTTFFDLEFADDPVNLRPPALRENSAVVLAEQNEREANKGCYSTDDRDVSVFLTDIRMKLKPCEWGLGGYPNDVWLRLVVANDDTVVFAEWLPSRPAFVASFNENDSRLVNQSQAHEMIWAQDQATNLMSSLLLKMKQSLLSVLMVNKDIIGTDVYNQLKDTLKGENWYEKIHLLAFSLSEMSEMGMDAAKQAIVDLVQPNQNVSDFINKAFMILGQIFAILERLIMLSPQEQGQSANKNEAITATESAMIEATTSAIYSAIRGAIDEARAAQRRIIYESTMAKASNEIYLPVSQTFTKETLVKAGLKVVDEGDEEKQDSAVRNKTWKVTGSIEALEHDYIFTGRDLGAKPTNQQSAQTLIALVGQVIPLIGPQALGKDRIFTLVNEVFRLLGVDLKLEIGEQEDMAVGEQELQPVVQQLSQELQKVAQQGGENAQAIEAVVAQIEKIGQGLAQMTEMVAPQAGPRAVA